jgi:hypothetical protein
MNHSQLTAMRRTIDTGDLIQAECWIRECGRNAIKAWSALPDEIKADVLSVAFVLARQREAGRGRFRVSKMQEMRLSNGWSMATAAKHMIAAGLKRTDKDMVNSLESNPRQRAAIGRETVHCCESVYDQSWEELNAQIRLELIAVPERSYEKGAEESDAATG